ncbi:hypothetical protein, partial [Enterobacter intestinihominis]
MIQGAIRHQATQRIFWQQAQKFGPPQRAIESDAFPTLIIEGGIDIHGGWPATGNQRVTGVTVHKA